jgi:hypothetical protein
VRLWKICADVRACVVFLCLPIQLFGHLPYMYLPYMYHTDANSLNGGCDPFRYHGAILLEWSHGQYCTVVELATLNGVGGRWGRANWYADKLADSPELYRAMPPAMICPWAGQFAEVRCHDVKATSLEEFKDFVGEFTGTELRFLDPHFFQSAPVRLAMRHQTDIHRYFLNYVGRDRRYTESFRNCQTYGRL